MAEMSNNDSNVLPSDLGGGSSGSHREDPQNKQQRNRRGGKGGRPSYQVSGPTIPMEQIVPLQVSKNRWVPNRVAATHDLARSVQRLLNKLTFRKFDTISDRIIEFANLSVKETDGATLKMVIHFIYKSAISDSLFVVMYAELARKMLDMVSVDIKDDNVKDPNGRVITGGNLSRKYLLNHCQEDFERGWKVNLDLLLSEEYYVAAKAKRRGLGLIMFIGELFKLQMLTERIIHECIKKLLSNVSDPEEEETESLCKLMTTVGKDLDHKRAKLWMDIYFDRMSNLLKSNKLPTKTKFIIQDVIDLRSTQWVPRRNANDKIQELHENLKAKSHSQAQAAKRIINSHRDKNQRGGNVNAPPVPAQDGAWTTVGSPASSRKTRDLTNFGKIARRVSLGPPAGGVFARLNVKSQMAKTASHIGTADILSPPNMESSSSTERQKELKLLPRGKSTPISENTPDTLPVKLTEAKTDKKLVNMLAEFWSVMDVQELVRCTGDLGNEYHTQAIFKMLESTIDKKEDDVKLMAKVFRILVDDKVVTKESFKKSLGDFIEVLDDISIDVPQAYKHIGILLIGARIELVDLKELQRPLLSLDGLQPPAAKLTAEYLKALKADAGEQAMVHHYQESAFDFKSLFPENEQTDEAFNNFLDRQDLSALTNPGKGE